MSVVVSFEIELLKHCQKGRARRSGTNGDLLRFYLRYPAHIDARTLAESAGGSTGRSLE